MAPNDPDLKPSYTPSEDPYAPPTPEFRPTQPAEVNTPQPVVTAPSTDANFTYTKKRSKAPLIIMLTVVVLALATVAGYYVYSSFMAPKDSASTQTEQTTETIEAETTPESIDEDISDIAGSLEILDDSELQDETISDATLNQ